MSMLAANRTLLSGSCPGPQCVWLPLRSTRRRPVRLRCSRDRLRSLVGSCTVRLGFATCELSLGASSAACGISAPSVFWWYNEKCSYSSCDYMFEWSSRSDHTWRSVVTVLTSGLHNTFSTVTEDLDCRRVESQPPNCDRCSTLRLAVPRHRTATAPLMHQGCGLGHESQFKLSHASDTAVRVWDAAAQLGESVQSRRWRSGLLRPSDPTPALQRIGLRLAA